MIREITENELNDLLILYQYLHENTVPKMTAYLKSTWEMILRDNNHHIKIYFFVFPC